ARERALLRLERLVARGQIALPGLERPDLVIDGLFLLRHTLLQRHELTPLLAGVAFGLSLGLDHQVLRAQLRLRAQGAGLLASLLDNAGRGLVRRRLRAGRTQPSSPVDQG